MTNGLFVGSIGQRIVQESRSEESSVPGGESAASVQRDGVLVKVACFHEGACVVPLQWVVAVVFLNQNPIAHL